MSNRPTVSVYLLCRDAANALTFYKQALGAEEIDRWIDPESGKIGHAEFRIGNSTLYLADEYPSMDNIGVKSPSALNGTSLNLWVEVGDVRQTLKRALDQGARLLEDIEKSMDGVRCRIADPAGHCWTLAGK